MAKKHKRAAAPPSPAQLRERIQMARDENRTQQALELAKQLHSAEPSPAHRELLLTVYLERARQLRHQGQPRDARTVLENVVHLAGTEVSWREKAAVELAAAGEIRRALELLEAVPDSPARARVLGHAADAAVQQGPAGKALLPENLQATFDLVLQASRQLEAVQDDAARESLQGIGLTSPFLEWKLFLRGLQAYYAGEEARALENWSRLNPERVPARLAAPFRFQADPAFRSAQPPEAQTYLRRQLDRFQGGGLVTSLRGLQSSLNGEQLAGAFRMTDQFLSALRREAPDLVPRLASCFYWSIIQFGQERDVERYRRLFGPPADDPELQRLEALAREQMHHWDHAHAAWQKYGRSLENNPAFPGELGKRARALVWLRMGRNAAHLPDAAEKRRVPAFLRDLDEDIAPLKPSAEECYKHSLELVPDQLETHEALVQYYHDRDKEGLAERAAKKLLEQFPDHGPTLALLADRAMEKKKYADALKYSQRALKVNPLDRRLRSRVSLVHQHQARALAEKGDFDGARAEYQSALAFSESKHPGNLLAKMAALEFKANNAERAEELLHQAAASPRLDVAYQTLIEVHRFKLPKPLKVRFDKEFAEALAAPAESAAAAAALETAKAHRVAGVTYTGQKTHEKKLATYAGKVPKDAWTELDLRSVCASLLGLGEKKASQRLINVGEHRFKESPYFPLLLVQSLIPTGPRSRLPPYWQVVGPIKRAQNLANKYLTGAEQKDVLDLIAEMRDELDLPDFDGGLFGFPNLDEMFDPGEEGDED